MENSFSERLNRRLRQLGLSQRELAAKIGRTEASVSRYCKGERIPKLELIQTIANALDVSASYFTEESEKEADLRQVRSILARHANDMTAEETIELINMLTNKARSNQ